MDTTTPSSFAKSVARVREGGPEGEVLGAGFVVGPWLLLTCEHVIRGAESVELWVEFPQAERPRGGFPAVIGRVRADSVDADLDCALVELDGADTVPAPLSLRRNSGEPRRTWLSFGFPPEGYADGTAGEGIFRAEVREGVRNRVQVTGANSISVGFSGAPLVDDDGFVVAMVSSIPGTGERGRLREVAYGVPAADLQGRYEELRVAQECPYPGLLAYTTAQADWFYGRDEAVHQLLTGLVRGPRVQVLLGASGSGKSSLVSAGLFPAIRQGHADERADWPCVRVQASDGVPALQEAIASVRDRARLVVVDQFEEVLLAAIKTANGDGTGADAGAVGLEDAQDVATTIDKLIGEGIAGQLLLVTRSDFYSTLEIVLPRLLQQQNGLIHLAGALSPENLRAVIEKPAQRQGWNVSAALTDRLVHTLLAGRSAAPLTDLPLLALHLRRLWFDSCDIDNTLTELSPGAKRDIRVAFASACDRSYRELSAEHQAIAREVLLDLVQPADPDKGIPAIRRRRRIAALQAAHPGAAEVITHLADRRIVATTHAGDNPEAVAELVHDSLIDRWDLLRTWLAQDPELRAWRERIDPRAERWHTGLTDTGDDRTQPSIRERLRRQAHARIRAQRRSEAARRAELLGGSDLAEAGKWRDDPRIPRSTKSYVQASFRQERQRQQQRRALMATLTILVIFTASTAAAALWQRAEAQHAARIATANSLAAQSIVLSSTDFSGAEAFAIAALQQQATEPAIAAAANATGLPMYAPFAPLVGDNSSLASVVFSPDGSKVATASEGGTVRVSDVASGKTVATRTGHDGSALVFAPDGLKTAVVSKNGTVRVLDAASGKTLTTMSERTGPVWSLMLSPDGSKVAVTSK